jgi:hypothetical protein
MLQLKKANDLVESPLQRNSIRFDVAFSDAMGAAPYQSLISRNALTPASAWNAAIL